MARAAVKALFKAGADVHGGVSYLGSLRYDTPLSAAKTEEVRAVLRKAGAKW